MKDNINEDYIKSLLVSPLQNCSKKGDSYKRRVANIEWIENLDRSHLEYGNRERQLLIHETSSSEKFFIQYPGKESSRKGDAERPWDFRPRAYVEKSLSWLSDMSFRDIWDIMNENFKKIIDSNKIEVFEIIVILLYRMAFMIDYLKLDNFNTKYVDLYIDKDIEKEIINKGSVNQKSFYKYNPDERILNYLENKCHTIWGGLSLEGFLYYNELLMWNEDCKYYYRDIIKKKKSWNGKVGRVNNALTHISIIGFLLGFITFSKVCSNLSRQGVSPISNKDLKEYFKDYFSSGELF